MEAIGGRKVRVVLVGVGGYGTFYAEHLASAHRAGKLAWVGAVDPTVERSAWGAPEGLEVPLESTLEAGLARFAPELVIIASPPFVHEAQATAALRAGCHVLCEKPLAPDLAAVRRLATVASTARGSLGVGFQWCYASAVRQLKADLLADRFGALRELHGIVLWPRPYAYFQRNPWAGRQWADDGSPRFDSVLTNATSHFLHVLLFAAGAATHATAMPAGVEIELYRANAIETYDAASLRATLPGGATVHFHTAHSSRLWRHPEFRIVTERASIRYGPETGGRLQARANDGELVDYGRAGNDDTEKIERMLAVVLGELAIPDCPPEAVLPHHQLMEAIHQPLAPVTVVGAPHRVEEETGRGPGAAIDGLGEAWGRAWEAGCLPSELPDAPAWVASAARLSLPA